MENTPSSYIGASFYVITVPGFPKKTPTTKASWQARLKTSSIDGQLQAANLGVETLEIAREKGAVELAITAFFLLSRGRRSSLLFSQLLRYIY